jgi:hypothetical protein
MHKTSHTAIHQRLQEFIHYSELKHLAYNISAQQQQKAFHSLAVLSFFPAEGKTLFCAALAMAYVEICRARVLVVDTTTFQNKGSLVLGDCFNGSAPQVDVKTLEELRRGPNAFGQQIPGLRSDQRPTVELDILRAKPGHMPLARENDFALIKRTAEDQSKQYGLVLLDTAPLYAKNRRNIDPLLVARLSDASALVVSRKFLDAPKLSASLKILHDPALHLIGIIANDGRKA